MESRKRKEPYWWNEIGEIMFAIMAITGIMYVIATIATRVVDLLTLVVGITSIALALVIVYAKRKGKINDIHILGWRRE